MVLRLECGLALSCWKNNVFFFSDLVRAILSFSLINVLMYRSELTVAPGYNKSEKIMPSASKKAVHITLSGERCDLNFFVGGERE